jgi:hypothetical protein
MTKEGMANVKTHPHVITAATPPKFSITFCDPIESARPQRWGRRRDGSAGGGNHIWDGIKRRLTVRFAQGCCANSIVQFSLSAATLAARKRQARHALREQNTP